MNIQIITKPIVTSFAITLLTALSSCTLIDPNYAAYKKQQQQASAVNNNVANPYGAPAISNTASTNPYAVPGSNGETSAPYQPIPGVQQTPPAPLPLPPIEQVPPIQPYTSLPAEPSLPSATSTTHIVSKGDTIWGLTKKYGITDNALRQANNLSSDVIWVGQRLIIPAQ